MHDCFPSSDAGRRPTKPRRGQAKEEADGLAVQESLVNCVQMMSSWMLLRDDRRGEYRHPEFPGVAFNYSKGEEGDKLYEKLHGFHLVMCFDVTQGLRPKPVVASCLVQLDHVFGSFEIFTVCVSHEQRGKGVCKAFIPQVVHHYLDRRDLYPSSREVRIYCERHNPAACACYGGLFPADRVHRFVRYQRLQALQFVHCRSSIKRNKYPPLLLTFISCNSISHPDATKGIQDSLRKVYKAKIFPA